MSDLLRKLLTNKELRKKEYVLLAAQQAEPMEPWAAE